MNCKPTHRCITKIFFILMLLISFSGISQADEGDMSGLFDPLEPIKAQYDIDCKVDFDSISAVISGTETISFINTSPRPLQKLALEWSIDSLNTVELFINGTVVKAPSSNYIEIPDDADILLLPQAVSPGNNLQIKAKFKRTYTFKAGDHQHLFTNWFPRIFWGMQTQDDFVVRIQNNSDYTFTSSGLYDPQTGIYHAYNAKRYGLYFLKGAEIMEDKTEGITVRITHTPAAKDCAELIMETALDVVAYYKQRFGLFPSDHIDIVQGAVNPMGGYPAATNLVVIHGMEKLADRDTLHWRWITAHEIGHQYWFEYVMPKPLNQMGWLMIGLGIYVDREYIKHSGLSLDQHLGLMNRFIDGVREGVDTRADVYDDYLVDIDFDFNNVVIHGKGYSIISALNCILGDELFDKIQSRCLREFAGKRMGFYDFQTICEQESRQDLDWFFDQWVRSTRFPSYAITMQECTPNADRYISDIIVERTGTLDMPVPVTAFFADNTHQTKFTERMQSATSLRFESAAVLDSAILDAGNEIAMVIPPPNSEELAIRKKLNSLPSKADIDSLSSLVAQALDLDIEQTLFWGQLGRKLYDWGLYEDALAVFKRRCELLEKMENEWSASAYGWQGLLLDLLGRRNKAIDAYKKALEIKFDRDFAYNGDPVTINREWLEKRLQTPFEKSDNNGN